MVLYNSKFNHILKHLKDRVKNNTILDDIGSYSTINRWWFVLKNDDTNYIINLIEYIEDRYGNVTNSLIEKIVSKFDNEVMK